MPEPLFPERLWQAVNEHFRSSGQFYQEAPRSRAYTRKARAMYQNFPSERRIEEQAAYLVKNLVNLQRFPDANKRTASVLLEVFLETQGYRLECRNEEYAAFLLQVQRGVPPSAWDGRTFSLRPEYIAWQDDAYHRGLAQWFAPRLKKKN